MARLDGSSTAACGGMAVGALGRAAGADRAGPARAVPVSPPAVRGSISGRVSDDAAARSPARWCRPSASRWRRPRQTPSGQFSLDALPAGDYALQAHLTGSPPPPRDASASAASPRLTRLQLRRSTARSRPRGPGRSQRDRSWRPGSGCPHAGASDETPHDTAARRRSSAHRDRVAAPPHQAQHPEGRAATAVARRRETPRFRPASLFGRALDSAASFADVASSPTCRSRARSTCSRRRLRTGRSVRRRRAAARRRLPRARRAGARRRLDDARRDERGRSVVLDRRRRVRIRARPTHSYNFGLSVQHAGIPGRQSRRRSPR